MIEENNKMVTVYIPTKNRVFLLKRAVESVLNQSYKNIEIIVVDDSSEDDTEKLMNWFTENNKNIFYFKNKESMGACFCRNLALNHARGEFITGLDDDDYFLPNRILNFINFRKKINMKSIIYSNCFISNEWNKQKKKSTCTFNDLLEANYIGNQIFTETSIMRDISGFDNDLKIWQDLDCWLRLLKKFEKAYNNLDYSYVVDTSHGESRITNNKIDKIKESFNKIIIKNNLNKKQIKKLSLHYYARNEFDLKFIDLIKFYKYFIFLNPSKIYIKKILKI